MKPTMELLFFVSFLIFVLSAEAEAEGGICYLPVEPGPCVEFCPRWAYNSVKGACEKFTYGGCDGNENNFNTKEECENICVVPINVDVCCLSAETGPCKAAMKRYAFDYTTGTCKSFTYGGCKGNGNNFKSKAECENTCCGRNKEICCMPTEIGPCNAIFKRWTYDYSTGGCTHFFYGGCRGNKNNFDSIETCEDTCVYQPPADVDCYASPDPGPCYGYFVRYYFESSSGICKQFIYGGCGGNTNNFETIGECFGKCRGVVD